MTRSGRMLAAAAAPAALVLGLLGRTPISDATAAESATQPAPPLVRTGAPEPGSQSVRGPTEDLVARVDVEQKLGDALPLRTLFRDESGAPVELGSYFGKRPVVVALARVELPRPLRRSRRPRRWR